MTDILESNEKKFSQKSASADERENYINHLQSMFHKTTAPAIRYKGQVIPERLL